MSRRKSKLNESAYYPPDLPWQPSRNPGVVITADEAKEKLTQDLAARGILKPDRMEL